MSINYIKLRDDFTKEIQGLPGVVSVGLSKKDDNIVLVVAIDADQFNDNIPRKFRGVDVILRDLGHAEAHTSWRLAWEKQLRISAMLAR
jgi:hypothetical protein